MTAEVHAMKTAGFLTVDVYERPAGAAQFVGGAP